MLVLEYHPIFLRILYSAFVFEGFGIGFEIDDVAAVFLLCQNLLYGFASLYMITMGNEIIELFNNEGEIKALRWERQWMSGPDLMDIDLDIEGQEKEYGSRKASFYGVLSKVSRNIEEVIEQIMFSKFSTYREQIAKQRMNEAYKRHPSNSSSL